MDRNNAPQPQPSEPKSPPVDGPLANDSEVDRALFGPWGDSAGR